MSEEGKNHFNLYKFFCFPWGVFVLTPCWFGIIKEIDKFLSNITFTDKTNATVGIPWWCSWALFVVGEIVLIVFLAVFSYILPKGKRNYHNIYVLIAPEEHKDDKYITSDFVESFERYAKKSIDNVNIIVPNILKREGFNRRVKRAQRHHKSFWKGKSWKRLHKKLRGVLYLSGTLSRRSSGGKEKYVFCLSATIGYNDLNKNIVPMMLYELAMNFPERILINKEFELEEFDSMSDRFATLSEYLIGWAHLVSGDCMRAYNMHFDIYSNNKQSFFKRGALNDLSKLLHSEIAIVLRDCKKYPIEFVLKCVESTDVICPNTDTSTLQVARFLIMTSTDDTFDSNLTRAKLLTSKARINSQNRQVVHADRAYLSLLKGDYSKAESEYRALFKKPNVHLLEGIVDYCDEQIKDGCNKERPTAYYVKVLMLQHLSDKDVELKKSVECAKKKIPIEFAYYHNKLNGIIIEEKTDKKKPK